MYAYPTAVRALFWFKRKSSRVEVVCCMYVVSHRHPSLVHPHGQRVEYTTVHGFVSSLWFSCRPIFCPAICCWSRLVDQPQDIPYDFKTRSYFVNSSTARCLQAKLLSSHIQVAFSREVSLLENAHWMRPWYKNCGLCDMHVFVGSCGSVTRLSSVTLLHHMNIWCRPDGESNACLRLGSPHASLGP